MGHLFAINLFVLGIDQKVVDRCKSYPTRRFVTFYISALEILLLTYLLTYLLKLIGEALPKRLVSGPQPRRTETLQRAAGLATGRKRPESTISTFIRMKRKQLVKKQDSRQQEKPLREPERY